MGRVPTPTILISLATWLGIYSTHQIPDSMCTKALASPNASQQCLHLNGSLPLSLAARARKFCRAKSLRLPLSAEPSA